MLKLIFFLGHLGPALCLFVMAGAGCNIQLIIAMLMLSQVVEAGNYGGWLINHIDIAPSFSGNLVSYHLFLPFRPELIVQNFTSGLPSDLGYYSLKVPGI